MQADGREGSLLSASYASMDAHMSRVVRSDGGGEGLYRVCFSACTSDLETASPHPLRDDARPPRHDTTYRSRCPRRWR